MESDKIKIGIPALDKILDGGFKKGELIYFLGPSNHKTAPFGINHNVQFFNKEIANDITEEGRCRISEIRKYLEENGIPIPFKTVHEKIGEHVYPVTYGPNGIVTIDYPDTTFCSEFKRKLKEKNDNSTGSITE